MVSRSSKSPLRIRSASRRAAALEYITRLVSTEHADYLPDITAMAKRCGISRVTMWKALQAARQQGLVVLSRNRYSSANTTTPRPAPDVPMQKPTIPLSRDTELQSMLINDILTGVFPRGNRLPRNKLLCARYGTSHTTLTRILHRLREQGVLTVKNRAYHTIQSAAPETTRSAVLCIKTTLALSAFSSTTPRSGEFWRTIERECHHRGLGFESCSIWELREFTGKTSSTADSLGDILKDHRFTGIVIWALSMSAELLMRIINAVLPVGVPVGLLCEGAISDAQMIEAAARRNPLLRIFNLGLGERCGREAATFLFNSGYRSVAFFSSRKDEPRFKGLEPLMRLLGGSAELFTPSVDAYEASHGDPAQTMRPLVRRLNRCIEETGSRTLGMFAPSDNLQNTASLLHLMQPVFSAVLKRAAHTVWVGANDIMALLILDFLARAKVQVPRDLGVMGFDDTLEAFTEQMTSYNFNPAACAVAVMDHITDPPSLRRLVKDAVVEVPGYITPRRTTQAKTPAVAV